MFRVTSSFRNNVAMYLLSDDVSATKRDNFSRHQQASGIGTEDSTFSAETGLLDLLDQALLHVAFILFLPRDLYSQTILCGAASIAQKATSHVIWLCITCAIRIRERIS